MQRRVRVVLIAVVVAAASLVVAPGAPATGGVVFQDAAGLHVTSAARMNDRQYAVSVSTAALGRAVNVRILVPADYATTTDRLPVLYLYHGTSGRADDWVRSGGAEAATAGQRLIVVMPDAGFDGNGGGWFTNWVDTSTALGPSQWETFHVDQLIPWVDANLRTIAARGGRAVAGLSQGGFGSMTYAARHPDRFVSAASFSGAPDIDADPVVAAGATVIIEATAFGLDGVQPEAMFGSRVTNEINWQGHDPADLVTNLRPVDVWLYTATGVPGDYDDGPPDFAASGIEQLTYQSTMGFVRRADDQGVPYHLDDYTYGTHTWPYWARDLREYLPHLMATFAAPPAPPAAASYLSVEPQWSQWGWSVTARRMSRQAFTALTGATCAGFTLQGTGTAVVTTPPCFAPGAPAVVRVPGRLPATVTADGSGRVQVEVPLGVDVPVPPVMGVPVIPGTPTTVSITPA